MNRTQKVALLKGVQAGTINLNTITKPNKLCLHIAYDGEDSKFMIDEIFVSKEDFDREYLRQRRLNGTHKIEVDFMEDVDIVSSSNPPHS